MTLWVYILIKLAKKSSLQKDLSLQPARLLQPREQSCSWACDRASWVLIFQQAKHALQ